MELIITNRKGEKFTVLYDEQDHESVLKRKWYVIKGGYVVTTGTANRISMHRHILKLSDSKLVVDHINHNPCDNRRCNLRICTHAENMKNRSPYGRSKYLGVKIALHTRKDGIVSIRSISSCIRLSGKSTYLGCFKNEEDAARAYDKAAKLLHGQFANLNFPNE